MGFEPTTYGLKVRSTTVVLHPQVVFVRLFHSVPPAGIEPATFWLRASSAAIEPRRLGATSEWEESNFLCALCLLAPKQAASYLPTFRCVPGTNTPAP